MFEGSLGSREAGIVAVFTKSASELNSAGIKGKEVFAMVKAFTGEKSGDLYGKSVSASSDAKILAVRNIDMEVNAVDYFMGSVREPEKI